MDDDSDLVVARKIIELLVLLGICFVTWTYHFTGILASSSSCVKSDNNSSQVAEK